jgi:hypothetical protein
MDPNNRKKDWISGRYWDSQNGRDFFRFHAANAKQTERGVKSTWALGGTLRRNGGGLEKIEFLCLALRTGSVRMAVDDRQTCAPYAIASSRRYFPLGFVAAYPPYRPCISAAAALQP